MSKQARNLERTLEHEERALEEMKESNEATDRWKRWKSSRRCLICGERYITVTWIDPKKIVLVVFVCKLEGVEVKPTLGGRDQALA